MIGILGMLIIDRRYKLAFWYDPRRTTRTIIPAMVVFIVWDFAGIAGGVFYHGSSMFSLPFTIAPQFPIEELLFLFLFSYVSLVVYRGVHRLWPHI